MGHSTEKVVMTFALTATLLSAAAFLLTLTPFYISLFVVAALLLFGLFVMVKLHDVVVH